MHDTELEQRLRMALRDEADQLPLRVDVERLQAHMAARRRATRSSRLGLLAAGVSVVAFGIAAIALNGGLPTGPLPGVGPSTPTACTPLPVTEATPVDGGGPQTPPAILLVDAADVVHRGILESFRMPGRDTVVVAGDRPPAVESRLDPRTTSIDITTAEGACLVAVELEIRPAGDGASPLLTEGAQSAGGEALASLSVTAPPPGEWRATVRVSFQTTADATATSQTTFRLVSTAPETGEPPRATPSTKPLPTGLIPVAAPFPVTCSQLPFDPVVLEREGNAETVTDPRTPAFRSAIRSIREAMRSITGMPASGWVLVGATATRAEYVAHTTSFGLAHLALSNDGTGWTFIEGWVGCVPRAVLEGMSRAEWLFDTDAPAAGPEATSLDVLVSELACTGGRGLDGRLRPPDIRYGDTAIVVTFFAEPLPGGHDCPGSPPTRVTIELREPIGTRSILDGSFFPPSDPSVPRP